LTPFPNRRSGLSALLALAAIAAAVLILGVAPASASCTGDGTSTVCGSAYFQGGSLTLTMPSDLSWGTSGGPLTLTGTDTQVAANGSGNDSYTVNDATGSGAGWHVTASAAAFTCSTSGTCGTSTLGDFSISKSNSSFLDTTAPSTTCGAVGCTTATSSLTGYPIAIQTSATTIFSAAANSGMGSNVVPTGWWLTVPGSTKAGTYTSTVTVALVAAP
jgi:hypothetical protein